MLLSNFVLFTLTSFDKFICKKPLGNGTKALQKSFFSKIERKKEKIECFWRLSWKDRTIIVHKVLKKFH